MEILQALRGVGGDDEAAASEPAEGTEGGTAAVVVARTPMELVKVVYRDVPESLHEPAARGVVQVLWKLQGEGRVVQTRDQRWEVAGKAAL